VSLTALSNRALERAGLNPADAAITSDILIKADMIGIPTHGVVRLSSYTGRLRGGAVDAAAKPAVDMRAPSLAIVDGQNGLGPVVAMVALESAMQMAAETGIAYVGCRSSNHLGALVPYALKACEAGYLMMAGTGASTTMPPFGGAEARIGNNPLCIAAPCPTAPHFILDMAMSVAARGKIRAAHVEGRPIPEGWAVDALGQPTTDAGKALDGFLIAVGGHKGSGLSMAVDILSDVLSGARFLTGITSWSGNNTTSQDLGHFFLLIDPTRLIGTDRFNDAMNEFQGIVRSTPPADPAVPVMLPGEREQAMLQDSMIKGVPVSEKTLDEVRALAGA
jgi:LDH2 family malate/lactate/ureidoglycolate dehydrogenase